MTKTRLLQAINHFNPETGLEDVIKAAKDTIRLYDEVYPELPLYSDLFDRGLLRMSGSCCLLARAWKNGHNKIWVGTYGVELGGERESHSYSDVVDWFDGIPGLDAAKEALKILDVE